MDYFIALLRLVTDGKLMGFFRIFDENVNECYTQVPDILIYLLLTNSYFLS